MDDDSNVSGDPPQPERPENLPNGPVGDAIYEAARAHGLDPRMLGGIASIESSFQPSSNYNKPTQYKGLFQIGSHGPGSEWAQYGNGNIYDARDNAYAAARMLRAHSDWFKDTYGRDPSPSEVYMMHQQGRGFFSRGAQSNFVGNTPQGYPVAQTSQQHMDQWSQVLARRMNTEAQPSSMPALPITAGNTATPNLAGMHAGSTAVPYAGPGTPAEAAQSESPALPDFATHEEEPIKPSPMMQLLPRLRKAMTGTPQVPFPSRVSQRLIDMLGKQQG